MKKILGIGNALVDILVKMSDDKLIAELSLPKGSMTLVDSSFSGQVLSRVAKNSLTKSIGGSASNTIRGLAAIGIPSGYIGKIGFDEMGLFFKEELVKNNIQPTLIRSKTPTGKALGLISPDGERTFGTFLGAAAELEADDLKEHYFQGFDALHVEGYLVQNHALLKRALQLAKSRKMIVSMDLASYNVVEENLAFIREIVQEYVDILFANEMEAAVFSGYTSPMKALHYLKKTTDIAIVKTGSEGSLIMNHQKVYEIPAEKVSVTDTTGAGDLYASGFLAGWAQGFPVEYCGLLAAKSAALIIQHFGAVLSPEEIDTVKQLNRNLIGDF
jgi:sugar/nucleoside kinase (ribokinase family)